MLDLEALENAVRDWVKTASGLDDDHVIFTHQDGPDPDEVDGGPYITILAFDDGSTLGMYPEEKTGADGVPYTIEHWRIDGQIEAYGPGAKQILLNFKSKCLLPTFYDPLTAAGIAADPDTRINSLPNPKGRQWEEHAKLEVVFRLRDGTTEDRGEDDLSPPAWADRLSYTGPEMAPRPITNPITITNPDA